MLTHIVKLIVKIDPLNYLLNKFSQIGRLAKWVMILGEFDIQYVDRRAIKGQVIVDQLDEALLPNDHPMNIEVPNARILTMTTQEWRIYFHGSYTQCVLGLEILFVTPQGHAIPKSYRIMFPCTNNVAKYEALIISIKVEVEWKITELQLYGDSQIIIY